MGVNRGLSFLAVLAPLALLFSAPASAARNPIHVSKCEPLHGAAVFAPAYYPPRPFFWYDVYGYRYYQRPLRGNPSLNIDYVNVSSKPISSVSFGLVARGSLIAEVRDVGTFSPGAEIKHAFGLNPNVFPIGTALPECLPLHVDFKDGTKWRNPHLPALRRSLYEK